MKLRILLAAAISSLFAMSFVYAANANDMGDDSMSMMQQAPAGDAMGPLADNTDGSTPSQSGNIGNSGTDSSGNSSANNSDSNSNDDMSADTATGDDDY